jgi:zinc transport system substrate-binding protein
MISKNIKNKTCLVSGLIIIMSALSGCGLGGNKANEDGGRLKAAATIFPLYDIMKQVGGDRIDIVLILAPGASPHTYEASPGDVKNIRGTKMLFAIGGGIDDWTGKIAETAGIGKVVELDEAVELEKFDRDNDEDGHHADDHDDHYDDQDSGHHHGEFDPHYWLSPNAAKDIAWIIAENLGEADPENKNYYIARAEEFTDELSARDKDWKIALSELDNRKLIVFHDAWNYFAAHFGLEIVASFEAFPGKSPGPKQIADLQSKIAENNVKVLFVEPQLSRGAVDALANDLNTTIETLDPIGGVEGRNSYIELIDHNVRTVYNALR